MNYIKVINKNNKEQYCVFEYDDNFENITETYSQQNIDSLINYEWKHILMKIVSFLKEKNKLYQLDLFLEEINKNWDENLLFEKVPDKKVSLRNEILVIKNITKNTELNYQLIFDIKNANVDFNQSKIIEKDTTFDIFERNVFMGLFLSAIDNLLTNKLKDLKNSKIINMEDFNYRMYFNLYEIIEYVQKCFDNTLKDRYMIYIKTWKS